MTRISGGKRKRTKAKRFDPSGLRDLLRDGRLWVTLGVVVTPTGGGSHFRIISDGADVADILVEVETQPDQLDLTCRLAGWAGGNNQGVWSIPAVGSEVMVCLPEGKIDFQPTILGVLSSGKVPTGVAESVIVIANTKVLIHDGVGGAAPLPTLSEFNSHTHPSGMGPTSTPTTPATGTTVLEAK